MSPTSRAPGSVEERFWRKVLKTQNCWLWTAATTSNGYGIFAPRGTRTMLAHRWSYEQAIGPIPEGLHIDHTCGERLCVNPAHLEAVTQAENNRRSRERVTWTEKTHCKRGHPFDEANTLYSKNQRQCRTCNRERAAERYTEAHGGTTEAQFMASVIELARTLGWKVYHTYDSRRSEPGFPDLVLAHPMRGLLFRELKRDTGTLGPEQAEWIALLQLTGADAGVWHPHELQNRIVEELGGRSAHDRLRHIA